MRGDSTLTSDKGHLEDMVCEPHTNASNPFITKSLETPADLSARSARPQS